MSNNILKHTVIQSRRAWIPLVLPLLLALVVSLGALTDHDFAPCPRPSAVAKFEAALFNNERQKARAMLDAWETRTDETEVAPWRPYAHCLLTGASHGENPVARWRAGASVLEMPIVSVYDTAEKRRTFQTCPLPAECMLERDADRLHQRLVP